MPWTQVKCQVEQIRASDTLSPSREDQQSKLVDSIRFCDYETASGLIRSGLNLNFEDQSGRSPVALAVSFGQNAILQELLRRGADPDRTDPKGSGSTLLMGAVLTDNAEATRLLLLYGAKPNKADIYRGTALMYAAERGDTELVKLLLVYGADARMRDKFSHAARDSALRARHTEIAELLKIAETKQMYGGLFISLPKFF
jgi:ankyrin repeat protein